MAPSNRMVSVEYMPYMSQCPVFTSTRWSMREVVYSSKPPTYTLQAHKHTVSIQDKLRKARWIFYKCSIVWHLVNCSYAPLDGSTVLCDLH